MAATHIRTILEAKVASLRQAAGEFKTLSEQQGIADDAECPPEDPEKFRARVLEHKRHAVPKLMAANTLDVVLAQRTEAEQVAMMRDYAVEFGQLASRNARLSEGLADDDPRKAEIDDDGRAATFVASVLTGLLNDVAPAPMYVPPTSAAAHRTIARRLGQVLGWTANLVAVVIIAVTLLMGKDDTTVLVIGLAFAAIIWAGGRALRYILAGTE
jgi:hypothetical protein